MKIPKQVTLFTFPGFGPAAGIAVAALTQDDKLVLADAEGNPGTSLTNGLPQAVQHAVRTLGYDDQPAAVYQWSAQDPTGGSRMWKLDVAIGGAPVSANTRVSANGDAFWSPVDDWESDEYLVGAVDALEKVGAQAPKASPVGH